MAIRGSAAAGVGGEPSGRRLRRPPRAGPAPGGGRDAPVDTVARGYLPLAIGRKRGDRLRFRVYRLDGMGNHGHDRAWAPRVCRSASPRRLPDRRPRRHARRTSALCNPAGGQSTTSQRRIWPELRAPDHGTKRLHQRRRLPRRGRRQRARLQDAAARRSPFNYRQSLIYLNCGTPTRACSHQAARRHRAATAG